MNPGAASGPAAPESWRYRSRDRRGRSTPRFSRFTFSSGRRQGSRRGEEHEGSFVDRYGWRCLGLVLWVAAMNALDSFFTIWHLQAGGIELNPVAQALLATGRINFVVLKSVLIALALLVLCMHKNFALARLGLWAATAAYTVLVGYHLLLFRL